MAKSVSAYRSEMHGRTREGMTEYILLPTLHDEVKLNVGAETAGDLISGVRDKLISPTFLHNQVCMLVLFFFYVVFLPRALSALPSHARASPRCAVELATFVWGTHIVSSVTKQRVLGAYGSSAPRNIPGHQ